MQCSSTSFRINSATSATFAKAQIGSRCSEDYIGIEGIYIHTILKIYLLIFNFLLQDHHRLVLETFNQDTVEVFSALFQNQLLMQKSKVESALCGGSSTAVIVETIVNC